MDGFAARMLTSSVARPLFLLRALLRRVVAPNLQQFVRALRRDALDGIARAQAGVRLAVGDVRAEPALLEDDRLPADRVVPELLQRRRGGPPAPLLRLGQLGERLLQAGREELLLGVERARLLPLLDVGAVAAVRGEHLLAVGLAEGARQREEPERLLERHRLGRHRLEERRGPRFLVALDHLGDVRAVAAGADRDRPAVLRVDAELVLLL